MGLGATIQLGATVLVLCVVLASAGTAQAQWTDSFESPEASWWQLSQSTSHDLKSALRVFQGAKDDLGFEKLSTVQRGKTPILLAHRIKQMLVIDELVIRLWVRSKRPGTQLAARITLPKTIDPATGQRLTVIVYGQATTEADRWTMLKIEKLTELLDSKLPTLRKTHKKKIDSSGAFVDLVVLQDDTGPGENQISVDGLIIDGVAFAQEDYRPSRPTTTPKVQPEISRAAATAKSPPRARIAAGVLEIDDAPAFVRAIQWSGEPFEFLKSLGFNAVELPQAPTEAQDQDAARLGIWIVAPPVFEPSARQKQRAFRSVIAWSLGEKVGESELESARAYVTEYRSQSVDSSPIFIAGASSCQWEWSRIVDLQLIDPGPPFGQNSLEHQGQRLKAVRSRGKPGVPAWTVIHTEPAETFVAQWSAFAPTARGRISVSPEQVRLQALHAVLSGARGLKFRSKTRLDGKLPIDELRAATLKWLNLQLDIIAPWAAGGDASILAGSTSEVLLGTIATERAALFVIANQSPASQFEPASPIVKKTKISSLGSQHERTPLFQVSWRGVRQLNAPSSKVRGATEVERNANVDFLIIADDEAALRFVKEILESRRTDLAATQLQVASLWLQQSQQWMHRTPKEFATVEAKLSEASRQLTSGNEIQALQSSEEALRAIARVRRYEWDQMTYALPNPLMSPLCVSAELAVAHADLSRRIDSKSWSRNLVSAGELDSLERLEQSGWLAFQTKNPDFATGIELCERDPHSGRAAVALFANASTKGSSDAELTVAITSAGAPVHRGDLVRYRLWIRADKDRAGPGENLVQFFDSLGGRNLGFSQPAPRDWQPVTFYRFAPEDGKATLTIALHGAGAVNVDSVEIQKLTQDQTMAGE